MERISENAQKLVQLYLECGYMRIPNEDRFDEGSQSYKKGWELRFSIKTDEKLIQAQQLLKALGFRFGKPFMKVKRKILPVYGYEQVSRFQRLLSTYQEGQPAKL